jgi:Flp pilus assembly protein TadG
MFIGEDRGQAIILAALMMMTLLFFVGLAVDAGQLFVAKRTQQEAADSAAFAGAIVLYKGGSQPPSAATGAAAVAQAIFVASLNGYVDGVNNTTVIVHWPPQAGLYLNDQNHVEVTIRRQVQTALVPAQSVFNPVTARGVAGAETYNNGYALIALDSSCTANTVTVSPNMDIHLYGGGMLVNSCSSTAMSGFTAGQDLQICPLAGCPANGAFPIDVVGGTSGQFFPGAITVNTGIAPLPDPFAGYPKPLCTGTPPCSALPLNSSGYGGNTAFAGVWTGTLDGYNLCGGIYILKGSGMGGDIGRDTSPGHLDPNTGLPCDGKSFIFNTMSNYPLAGGTCSQIGRNGNHPILLRPMTTGVYKNFQLYQDPACTVDVQIGGNQDLDAGGTIYIPNAAIHLNGNPATIDGGQLIAKRLDIQNGNLNITYGSGNAAQPILPRLSE